MHQVRARHTSSCTPGPRCSTSSSRTAWPAASSSATSSPARSSSHSAHAVVLATGGYGNVFFLSTNAKDCNVTAAWRAHQQGRPVRQPLLHADPPDLHPGERRVPVEAHADVGVAPQRRPHLGARRTPTTPAPADQIPEDERDYFLERKYPAFGNLVPRDVASRNAKTVVDEGHGVGPLKNGVYLDFADAIDRLGEDVIRERYGNLFDMYERITDEDPYKVPMRIYPAIHYTMGGLWVDYNLMTNVPGLFVLGEANFSDHGANRLGASALMQGLADGYFVLPYTIGDYLAGLLGQPPVPHRRPRVRRRPRPTVNDEIKRLLSIGGTKSVDHYHRELGKIMWDYCGMARDKAGLEKALVRDPRPARGVPEGRPGARRRPTASTSRSRRCSGSPTSSSSAELMCRDALDREESCGGHFRVEHQTDEGEAQRDDENFAYVGAWEWSGEGDAQTLHKEPLDVRVRPPRPSGATSRSDETMNLTLKVWRQDGPSDAGPLRDLRRHRHQRGHVVPRDARRRQRAADRRRAASRSPSTRLPRGHLRHLRPDDQRPGPRPAEGHRHLPAPHAEVPRRRRRSPSSRGGPPRSRSSRTSSSTARRSTASSRPAATSRADTGAAPRRQPHPDPQAGGRRRHGRRRLHRLRRLRGRLPEQRRPAVHLGQARPPQPAAPGPGRALAAAPRTWSTPWRSSSAPAPTTASARRRARRRSRIDFIAYMNRDYLKAQAQEPQARRPALNPSERPRPLS